jgi:signal transduction histidine kinase
VFRSASLRLAALYTTAFAVAVVVLGVVTVLTTRTALSRQFDGRILSESAALAQEYRIEGLTGVSEAVQERDRTPGALDYGLEGPGRRAIAGRLAGQPAPTGWSELSLRGHGDEHEKIRVYTADLGGGYRLLVGGDDESIETVDRLLAVRFMAAILGVVLIGLAGGYSLGRGMGRRIAAITDAAEAIIDGDLSRRVPAASAGDDLDRLAATFNRMLDRIAALMESLRQVSNDIAHDLRTPLTRLRGRLEANLARPAGADQAAAIEAALGDLDAILATFAALLRIAQIEGGVPAAGSGGHRAHGGRGLRPLRGRRRPVAQPGRLRARAGGRRSRTDHPDAGQPGRKWPSPRWSARVGAGAMRPESGPSAALGDR